MERLITVRGAGRLSLKPDTAAVELNIVKKDRDYSAAMEASDKLLAALRAAVAPLGFGGDDLKTSSFNVNTEYDSVRENGVFKNVFSGYRCEHRLRLEFPFDTARLSGVLTAVSRCAAEPEIYVSFTVKDKDGAKAELLRRASLSARADAEVLAAASGVKLGRLVSVNYGADAPDFYSPTRLMMNARASVKCESAGMDMAPEDISLTESAVFTWELSEE